MKNLLIALITLFIGCKNNTQTMASHAGGKTEISKNQTIIENKSMTAQNIYQFKVTDLSGKVFDFSTLKGKKIMVVNTASKCGLTKQYKDLQALYEKYGSKNFVIVGFPANNFGSQEPGSDAEIASFCSKNYGVTFPMMSKISVEGQDMNEVYQFLTKKSLNGLQDSEVSWNFQKYLVGTNGQLEEVLSPQTSPTDSVIVDWINK
ncbi:MAG: hypothetical protein RLZZ312_1302 [Bacteroidota bacterium]|jgi:glutathione peroxidase